MWRRVLRWLAPLIVTGSLILPVAGQPTTKKDPPTPKDPTVGDLRWKDESGTTPQLPSTQTHVPVLEFILAIAGTVAVLFILCTPSRKR